MSMAAGVTDNRTILQKADLALSDLVGTGGLLQPEQAAKFMRIMIKASRVLGMATVVPMRAPKQWLNKIGFSGRILRPGVEAQALAAGDRAKPDTSRVELDAQLFKAEVRLDNEVLEDNIERAELRQTIMQMMSERIALDVELRRQVVAGRLVERLLDARQRQRRSLGQLAGDVGRGLHQDGIVDHVPDQAPFLGLLGADLGRQHGERPRPLLADQARQEPGAAAVG